MTRLIARTRRWRHEHLFCSCSAGTPRCEYAVRTTRALVDQMTDAEQQVLWRYGLWPTRLPRP